MRILGIDPGIAIVGYGVIDSQQLNLKPLDFGVITTEAKIPVPERLDKVYCGMIELIRLYSPDVIAFEELFFQNNQKTAMLVSQARGVLLLAGERAKLPLYEYTPKQVKQSVVGYGHAEKSQVQYMVKLLLNLKQIPKPDDAADALAVAICQSNSSGILLEQFRIK